MAGKSSLQVSLQLLLVVVAVLHLLHQQNAVSAFSEHSRHSYRLHETKKMHRIEVLWMVGGKGNSNPYKPSSSRPTSTKTATSRGDPKVVVRKPSVTASSAGTSSTPKKPDSWKVLMKKFDTEKRDDRYAKQNSAASSSSIQFDLNAEKKLETPKHVNIPSTKDELQCIHFEDCSGCTLKSDFTNAPVMQRAREFFRREDTPFDIHIGNITAWRTHVKLAVQPMSKWGGLKFGLYRMNSHEVEAIPQCRVQHPVLNEAAEYIRLAALDAGVKGYSAPDGRRQASGELRYIQLSLERSTGKVQLVLVWNAAEAQDAITTLPRLVKLLKSRHPNLWHSITVNFNTMTTNNIFDYEPAKWRLLWGLPFLKEKVQNANFYFRPQIFRQANLDAFGDMIIPTIAKHIPPDSVVAELYAGIGLMGINVAHRAQTVLCSDSNEYVADIFDRCASSLPGEDSAKVYFECLDAANAIDDGQCDEADVLLVDPPRRGLQDKIRTFLLNKREEKPLPGKLRRLIYVGCGFEAVERDCG